MCRPDPPGLGQDLDNSQPAEDCPTPSRIDHQVPPVGLRAFRLTVAYDGTGYYGWQRQPDLPTVQACLEVALVAVTGQPKVIAYASSRTDTGVHAIGQSVVFKTSSWHAKPENLTFALNTKLPADIVVREAVEIPLSFHPLRDSSGKRYRYQIYSSRKADPIGLRTQWWVRRRLSLEAMRAAAEHLLGLHDFCSFQSAGSPRENTVREVRSLAIQCTDHLDGQLFTVEIEASGFLYNMVRNIVGTLVQVGVGNEKPEWVAQVLEAKDRRLAGATAPPQGLCLTEVLY